MDARADIRDLLAAAQRGSPEAIGRLFQATRGHLLQLAGRELPPELRAKIAPSDVVQDTAVDVQRNFGQFSGDTAEELFAWLREILRNNVVDAVRRYRDSFKRDAAREVSLDSAAVRRAGETLPALQHTPDGSAIRREEAAALGVVLARMPDDYRRVIELRYWQGLSFVEIAPQFGRSPDAVRKLWYRALERLQGDLAAATPGRPPAAPGST